jgi:hypothetical protein
VLILEVHIYYKSIVQTFITLSFCPFILFVRRSVF